jgi:protein SCO1/2
MADRAELKGAVIEPRLGAVLDENLVFLDENGQDIRLGQVFRGRPVMLTLGYFECPMLCTLVLNAALEGVTQSGMKVGEDLDIVSISIDPTEGNALAQAKRTQYQKALSDKLGHTVDVASWRFLTSKPGMADVAKHEAPAARSLANSIGFGYTYDEKTENYAHAAGLFFVTPQRVLSRTLWGLTFSGRDVKLASIEAGEGKVGSIGEQLLLTCFMFGEDGKYTVYVWGIMRLGALLTVAFVGGLLFVYWRRDKKRDASVSELP